MLVACGGGGSAEVSQREGERVATVNDEVILVQDVEAWALEHSVSPEEALDALVDEALLVSEARRRGQRPDRSVVRRAAVQEILAEVEAENQPADISSSAVQREHQATVERLAESDPSVVVPPLEDSADDIRAMLVGRERLVELQSLMEVPSLNEERVTRLLALPAID